MIIFHWMLRDIKHVRLERLSFLSIKYSMNKNKLPRGIFKIIWNYFIETNILQPLQLLTKNTLQSLSNINRRSNKSSKRKNIFTLRNIFILNRKERSNNRKDKEPYYQQSTALKSKDHHKE